MALLYIIQNTQNYKVKYFLSKYTPLPETNTSFNILKK